MLLSIWILGGVFLGTRQGKEKYSAEQFCILEKWAPDEFIDLVVLNKAVDCGQYMARGFMKQVTNDCACLNNCED